MKPAIDGARTAKLAQPAPLPLAGRGRGWGYSVGDDGFTPPLTPPHQGEGDRSAYQRRATLFLHQGVADFLEVDFGLGSLAELDERGRAVAVIPAPIPGCTHVGSSYGRGYFREYALNNLRNQVGSHGATHVVITNETQLMQGFVPVGGNSLTIQGIGYNCPVPGVPPDAKPKR